MSVSLSPAFLSCLLSCCLSDTKGVAANDDLRLLASCWGVHVRTARVIRSMLPEHTAANSFTPDAAPPPSNIYRIFICRICM